MTKKEREKAIAHGKEQLEVFGGEHAEFIKLAIEALEQEPCEDAVSRQTILEWIKESVELYANTYSTDMLNMWMLFEEQIKAMPSVTPKCKAGKWENGNPICPICAEDKFKDLDADIWADWQPKYCPNCGAEMESEE